MEKKETAKREKMSIESVVNIIGENPSFIFAILMCGVLTFGTMVTTVSYFPNFGGYVPYTDWRCLPTSEDCYSRTSKFKSYGWETWSKDSPAYVDSRCSIKLKDFDLTSKSEPPILELWENATARLGAIEFNFFDGNDQKIEVVSDYRCNNEAKSCRNEYPFSLGVVRKSLQCQLIFKKSTWLQKDTVLACDSTEIKLVDSEGLLTVVDKVKYIKLHKIGSYDFYCPDKDQYRRDNLCGSGDKCDFQLTADRDFYWETQGRTSFAIDWNLYCSREFLRSMIGSIYFVGALFGASVGGTLNDIIGRKRGALIGYIIVIAASFGLSASPTIEFMFVCRFLQGIGIFLGDTGIFVLLLEYTAAKRRYIMNGAFCSFFSLGYFISTLAGYLIKDWHWLASTSGFFCLFVSLLPLILLPESPRFLLVNKKDVAGAKKSLQWLIKLNKSDFDISSVELEDSVEQTREPSFIETMRDFWKYKEMLVQLLIQMWTWLVTSFIYYGFSFMFSFSWSSLGSNLYISYFYAAIGEAIAYTALMCPLEFFGRKPSNITYYLVGSATFLLGILPYKFSATFTVEQLSCLIGSTFVAAVFGSIYLYTIELAPTTHRGKMLGYCSFSARIGAFCGPLATLMFNWSKTGTLILFAVLSASAGLATLRLPDTKGVPTLNSAEEVQIRHSRKTNHEAGETVISNNGAVV